LGVNYLVYKTYRKFRGHLTYFDLALSMMSPDFPDIKPALSAVEWGSSIPGPDAIHMSKSEQSQLPFPSPRVATPWRNMGSGRRVPEANCHLFNSDPFALQAFTGYQKEAKEQLTRAF
jgi:hypothetical protein